jgi:CRISPR-associated protein Cas1
MGTVYITTEGAFLGKTDERLTVRIDQKNILDVPLIKVDGVVVLGRATVSPALVIELLERKIPLTYLSFTGKFLGTLSPELTKNIFVRQAQWRAKDNETQSLHIASACVRGKLKNALKSLQRWERDRPTAKLTSAIDQVKQALKTLEVAQSIESVRGAEGAGSAAYFSGFSQAITTTEFSFDQRNRRPPKDPVNAMLSLGYALLRHDIQSALNIVGFDPYAGFLHTDRYGRPSLALDLMEEFRPLIIDPIVLTCINRKMVSLEDFSKEPISEAVYLTDAGRQTFLKAYEQKKQSDFKHPVMGRKCNYREAFEIQARLLAKYLLGEIEQYPPLVMR